MSEDRIQECINQLNKRLGRPASARRSSEQPPLSQEQSDTLRMIQNFPNYGNPNPGLLAGAKAAIAAQQPVEQITQLSTQQARAAADMEFYQNLYKPKSEPLNQQQVRLTMAKTVDKRQQMKERVAQLMTKIGPPDLGSHSSPKPQITCSQDGHEHQPANLPPSIGQDVPVSELEGTAPPDSPEKHDGVSYNTQDATQVPKSVVDAPSLQHDTQQIKEHSAEYEYFQNQIEALQKQNRNYQSLINDLNSDQLRLQVTIQDKEKELVALRGQLQLSVSDAAHAEADAKAVEQISQHADALARENETLRQQLQQITETFQNIQTEIDRSQTVERENGDLKLQVVDQQMVINKLQAIISKQEAEVAVQSSESHNANQLLVSQLSQGQEQISQYQKEIASMRQAGKQQEENIEKMQQIILDQSQQITALQERITALQKQNETVANSVSHSQIDNSQIIEKLNGMQEIVDFCKQYITKQCAQKVKLNISASPNLQSLRQINQKQQDVARMFE